MVYRQVVATRQSRNHRHPSLEHRLSELESAVRALSDLEQANARGLETLAAALESLTSSFEELTRHYMSFLLAAGFVDKSPELEAWLAEAPLPHRPRR